MNDDFLQSLVEKNKNEEITNISQKTSLKILEVINDNDKIVAHKIAQILPSVAEVVDVICEQLLKGGRLFYVGAGTSGRLAVLDSAECPPTFGTSPDLVQSIIAGGMDAMLKAVENVEDDEKLAIDELKARGITPKDVVMGISASGNTAFVLSALKWGNQLGCRTIALCTRGSCKMEKEADLSIVIDVGMEVLRGSSRMKSGTAQKMLLSMISTTTMIRLGKVHNNFMIDLTANNKKLIKRAENIVASICDVSGEEAKKYLQKSNYQARPAILMCSYDISYQEALVCIDSPFQSLDEQLKKAELLYANNEKNKEVL